MTLLLSNIQWLTVVIQARHSEGQNWDPTPNLELKWCTSVTLVMPGQERKRENASPMGGGLVPCRSVNWLTAGIQGHRARDSEVCQTSSSDLSFPIPVPLGTN